MSANGHSWLAAGAAADGPPRRFYLVASLACHAVLLGLLYRTVPYRVQQERHAGERALVEQSLERTAHKEMERRVRAMEDIKDMLEQSAGQGDGKGAAAPDKAGAAKPPPLSPKPDALLAKAKELAAAIEATEQRIKAAELAKLLRIPEKKALAKVRAEDAARARLAPPLPKALPREAAVAQLEAQAKSALARRQLQLAAQAGGVGVNRGAPTASIGGRLDALASGMGMGNQRGLRGSSLDMASEAFSDERRFGAYLAPPAVDAATLRVGAGRKFGPGGPYANRVFIDNWYVIGPFQGSSADSIDQVYPPERGVDLDAVYFGKNQGLLKWTYQGDASYPTVPLPRAENAVYYAWTEVDLDRERDLWMAIGADDDSKLWFNDRLVWISGDGDKPWYRTPFYRLHDSVAHLNLAEGQRRLHFHKGRNTILLKLYNGADLMFFSVVLSPEPDGAPAPR